MSTVVTPHTSRGPRGPGTPGTPGSAGGGRLAHRGTGTKGSRILGLASLVGLAVLALYAFVITPADVVQGESVRFIYLHVPSANLAYLAFALTAFSGVMYLWKRTRSLVWDRLAGAAAEVGLLFTGICLITGMLWGKMTWGVYWTWDARLTTTALLFVLFLGYVAIRRLPAPFEVRAKRSAIAGIIAFVDVPIVHLSVEWWRTLHQRSTIKTLDPTIDGIMLFTLFMGFVVFLVVFTWLLWHRYRLAVLEDRVEERGLDDAIAERLAEGPAR
jgi:heme exporter protein C